MAEGNGKRRAAPRRRPAEARKREVLGVLLVAVSLLLLLGVLSYQAEDDALVQSSSLWTAFDQAAAPTQRARNALGLLGAFWAYYAVRSGLGYPVGIYPLVALIWGWRLFRGRPVRIWSGWTLYWGLLPLWAATSLGWLALQQGASWTAWHGLLGMALAGGVRRLLGVLGSFLFLLTGLLIWALLLAERDVQRLVDRLSGWGYRLLDEAQAWGQRMRLRLRRSRKGLRRGRAAPAPPSAEPAPKIPEPPPLPVTTPLEPSPSPEGSGGWQRPSFEAESPASPPEPHPRPSRQAEGVHAEEIAYRFPPLELLDKPPEGQSGPDEREIELNKQAIREKLATYGIEIVRIEAVCGPTVTLYELTPAPDVKISRITSLADDLALAMAAPGIRIIAPIPGKSAIGIEIPNRRRQIVHIRSLLASAQFRHSGMELPLALGKTVENEVFIQDLARMPHLLMAGATGSGKSVGINSILTSLLYCCHPADLKLVLIDPKKIELSLYQHIGRHFIATLPEARDPIVTEPEDAVRVLKSLLVEMELRYDLLADAMVRHIKDYNQKLARGALDVQKGHRKLPYIVVIIDELADLMMVAGREVEAPIARLAQMARAVGIHLVLATQRPSVDVITGLIKANFPARIAFQVPSRIDSRTIIDTVGAEQLMGYGDMLFMYGSRLVRLQGAYVSVEEVERVTTFIGRQKGYKQPYLLPSAEGPSRSDSQELEGSEIDPLFEEAARLVVQYQQGSVSLLQRRLKIGYSRAGRLIDQLEEAGIVGPFEGSKAREVLLRTQEELEALLARRAQGATE
ncbi:MAG: DNA translocase FtsK [Bacteroidetes bacterium]|nr:DNA translocase FtsK [Rhodothermia bacterium]MCS7154482.1 DNA translocase FtsK [Bacteroidota bacterium]MCX7906855.1 DNA translocase FtsK [Bacteroidota bacterium]MDW8136866.1 DNA translocase FtsK 4TM domain-containing protein [Bacteroidota bacterium]MDW8285264.1 DNA translocase FtsK 4TM domain-containing protein [Bacteroidota bacterium]